MLKKEMRTGNVAFETFVANNFRNLGRRRGVKAAELLSETGIDEVWTRVTLDGKGAGYALEALGIDVFTTGATNLKELVSGIRIAGSARNRIRDDYRLIPVPSRCAPGDCCASTRSNTDVENPAHIRPATR